MRSAMLGFAMTVVAAGGALAQGAGAPPMVEPMRDPGSLALPDPNAAQPTPGADPYASDPAFPAAAPPPPPPVVAGPPLDVDRVMDGVKKCWTAIPRVYGTEAQGGIARLRIKFTPDGRLDGAPMIIDKPQGAIGAKFAESAAKAVQLCQPYALPPERYAEWRQIEVKFDTIDPDNPPPPPPPAPATPAPGTAASEPPPTVSSPDGYVPSVPAPDGSNAAPQ